MTLVQFAASRGYKHGTVKRWVHEGMPVVRECAGRASGVVPAEADAWVAAKKARQVMGPKLGQRRASVVYFARRPTDGLIKIGFTSNIDQRLKDFAKKRGGSGSVVLLAVMPGDKVTELAIQGRFSAHRVRTEWFSPATELLAFIAEHARAA